jgi:hypothetical protein
MSSDTRSHLTKGAQRRFLWGFLILSAVLTMLSVPLIVNGQLRLDLAHRFGLAPGAGVEQIAEAGDGIALISAPIVMERQRALPQYRFRALYLARETGGGYELTSVDTGATLSLSLDSLDFIAATPDTSHLLIRDLEDEGGGAVLIETATGTVNALPSAESVPELPGNWDVPVWEEDMGQCNGYSPNAVYIACFENPEIASYLAGDWELQVRVYGDVEAVVPLYRGIGFRPFIGWSADDRWLYFQNERGIWRAEVRPDMFSTDN